MSGLWLGYVSLGWYPSYPNFTSKSSTALEHRQHLRKHLEYCLGTKNSRNGWFEEVS